MKLIELNIIIIQIAYEYRCILRTYEALAKSPFFCRVDPVIYIVHDERGEIGSLPDVFLITAI